MDRGRILDSLDPADRPLADSFLAAGQEQVFRFWPRLGRVERRALLDDLRGVDLELLGRLAAGLSAPPRPPARLEPCPATPPDDPERPRAVEAGRALLSGGKVAFYTVAGGQGTRLGFPGPKGCHPVGPFSGKTLFRWHAEKVLAASRRHGRAIPWVVMVSGTNEAATRRHFEEHAWFGLDDRVFFVRQGVMPAVDAAGRILLASPSRVALSPNGHGGALAAIASGGLLDRLRDRGVTCISYFQVDNALINPADPAFLGYHRLREAEISAKVVEKRDPLEKAGVVVMKDGRPGVVEYSELPEELARARDEEGRLRFRLANIAAHVLSADFLARVADAGLPWHVATKKVAAVDEEGRTREVTGHKFETFIFDAIPLARSFHALLADRAEEFAPLKNAEGENSPQTVRAALLARSRSWFEAAGRPVPSDERALEISPLTAYDRETFLEWLARAGSREAS